MINTGISATALKAATKKLKGNGWKIIQAHRLKFEATKQGRTITATSTKELKEKLEKWQE